MAMLQQTRNIAHHAKGTAVIIGVVFVTAMVGFFLVGQVYSEIQSRQLLEAITADPMLCCNYRIGNHHSVIDDHAQPR